MFPAEKYLLLGIDPDAPAMEVSALFTPPDVLPDTPGLFSSFPLIDKTQRGSFFPNTMSSISNLSMPSELCANNDRTNQVTPPSFTPQTGNDE